jgi:Tfp pilus assembly protein PilX
LSTRFFFHAAKADQRGFILISVLVLALLYFALLELMLMESAGVLRGAQRFRARLVAHTLAENAVELAAHQILFTHEKTINASGEEGTMSGKSRRLPGDRFEIVGCGTTAGSVPASASVRIEGHIQGTEVLIDRSLHSQ